MPHELQRQAQRALESKDKEQIRRVLHALERAPDAGAIPLLLALLDNPFWALRKQAASLLVRIGIECIPHIRSLLRSGSADQLYWSCYVLTQVEARGAPVLTSVLASGERERRLCAIHALARRKSSDAVDLLIQALDDPAAANRRQAADTLAGRHDEALVVDRLKQEIKRGHRDRVRTAVNVLARILGPRTMPILMTLLPWRDDDLRYAILEAISRLRVDGVLPLLIEHLGDRSPIIRRKVADLVAHFGNEALEPLAVVACTGRPEARHLALSAMSRISADAFHDTCRRLLDSEAVEDKYVAVHALGDVASPAALDLLICCFTDPCWVIRRHASEEIFAMGERAVPALVRGLESTDEETHLWSVLTLARAGRSTWPHVERALCAADKASRAFALSALAEAELPPEVVPALARHFDDEHWPIRQQAADCIRPLGPRALPPLARLALAPTEHVRFWSRKLFIELGGDHAPAFLAQLEALPHDRREPVLDALAGLDGTELAALLSLSPEMAASRAPRSVRAGPDLPAPTPLPPRPRALASVKASPEPAAPAPVNAPSRPWKKLSMKITATGPALLVQHHDEAAPPAGAPKSARQTGTARAVAEAPVREQVPPPSVPQSAASPAAVLAARPAVPPSPAHGTATPIVTGPASGPAAAIGRLLQQVVDAGGIEVYLRAGAAPSVKTPSRMAPLRCAELTTAELDGMAAAILGARRDLVGSTVDLSFDVESAGRCRARIFKDAKGTTLVLRPLGYTPPRLEDVGGDPLLRPLPALASGLVLVSGGAACGKTWTALALVQAINATREAHIATVEAPVEHVRFPHPALISQVDVPRDFPSIADGLHFARGCAPSVMYVGDVPDVETALAILEDADHGALVIATLRASSATEAIRKVVEMASVRTSKAQELMGRVLRASIRQALVPGPGGSALVAAREVLTAVPRVLAPVLMGRYAELEEVLISGLAIPGCRSMDAALRELKQL